jgi:excisionase family DNA binding protein
MSNPVHYERRFTAERRTRPRRRDGSSPAAPTPSPAPDRQPGPTALLTDRLWTVREAAAFLGRSISWVYKAAERGELPRARGMGWGLRFVPSELHAFARGEASGWRAIMRDREGGA